MLMEISDISGLEIYTPKGIFVGHADKFVIDPSDKRLSGIIVSDASPVLVEEGVSIKIPYRWVQSVGDIIILKVFPDHISKNGKVI